MDLREQIEQLQEAIIQVESCLDAYENIVISLKRQIKEKDEEIEKLKITKNY